jgi:hypothetical protein
MTRVTTASLAYVATQARSAIAPFLHYNTDHVVAPLRTLILISLLQD